MANKWYKGLTATAVAMAVAGVASMVPAFAEDTVAEPEAEGNSLVLAPAAEGNKTTEVSTITDAAGNVTTETTTTTTETKEEKDPDFQPTTSKTEDTYVDSTGDIIHTETKIETSETTSEVKKESSTEVSGETVEKGETYEAKTNPSADWDSLKENETVKFGGVDFTVQSKVTGKDDDGNTTYSVVMTYDVPVSEEDSPITQDELSEALGETLTKTGDNTYTYTNAEGKTVTVTVSNDESSEYTKVVVNVNVVKDVTVEGDAEIGNNMDTNIKDHTDKKGNPDEISVEEVLGYIGQDGVEVTYNDEGRVSKVVKDGKTYSFKYTGDEKKLETIDISDWANEKILALLGSEYKIVGNEIVDKDGHVLTFDEKQKIACRSTITVTSKTTTTTTDNVYGNTKEEAEKEALLAAQKAAVKAALEDYDLKDVDESKITIDGKTATYSYEKDGYQFSFTFNLSDSSIVEGETTEWSEDYIKKIEKSVKEDITKGQTTVVTSSSSATGGTYSVIGDESSTDYEMYLFSGKITPPEGAENVTEDSKGRVISFTYNGSSYSYSYTDKLKADDIAIFKKAHEVYHQGLGDVTVTVTDTDRIYKIKCTVNTTQTTKYDGKDVTYTTGAQIETNGDLTYYVNGNEKTTITAIDEEKPEIKYDEKVGYYTVTVRNYTDSDGNLYTVTTTSSVSLKDDEILAKVDPDGSLGATVKDGKVTLNQNGTLVTYDYKDSTVTVEITTNTESESKDTLDRTETSEEAIKTWIKAQKDSLGEGDTLYVGDQNVTDWTVDKIFEEYVKSYPDYSTMSQEEIKEYLLKLQSECKDPTSSSTWYYHADLDTGTTFTTTDGTRVNCVVIRDELHYRIDSSADTISKNEGKDYAGYLSDTVTSDGMTGYSEYRHNERYYEGLTGNQFYNVTGKVAYGTSTICNSESDANAKLKELQDAGKKGAVVVKVSSGRGYSSTTYVVYEDSADLVAYGYMNQGSNVCGVRGKVKGYDLLLSDLTMTSNGTVVAEGKNTSSYSISFTKVHKNDSTKTVTGDTLTLSNGKYDQKVIKTYNNFGGSYGLKLTGKFADKTYEGNGESSYSLYDTQKTETERGKATGVHYTGKLNYSYKVDKVDTAYRVDDVHEYDADVKEEWNKTVYNYTTKETVTEAVIGHVDSDSTPSTPSVKPSVDPTPSDPTSEPTVDPTPSEPTPTPTPSIPDEVIDDIIAEVEEEVTPIASVPKTGAAQNTAAAAASAMALGGIAFALSRKRRRK